MTEYKYAYPDKQEILLSPKRVPIRPFFDSEIEITELSDKELKGNIVHFENTRSSYIEPELIREENFHTRKKYFWFGKIIRVPDTGWVRLKETTKVIIELKNYRVIKREE